MTEQGLAVQKQQAAQILTVNDRARELAGRLKFMIANGNKLNDNEVYALAQYAAANDLNPFAQECYYLPGIGPCPGIVGWRKKAQEQLVWEAEKAGQNGAHFWTEDRPATEGEANFGPGDIAVVVTLRDWLSSSRWRHDIFETARQLKEFGSSNPMEEAKAFVGPEPVWTGTGVVFASENFGSKVEKFDRYERAKKRAEKIALRKRFPRVQLPEPAGAEVDFVDAEFADQQMPRHTEAENMAALGFGDPELTKKVEEPPAPEADNILSWVETIKAQMALFGKLPAITDKQHGMLAPILETALAPGDVESKRHAVLKAITGHTSLKEIDRSQASLLWHWLKPYTDTGGAWCVNPDAGKAVNQLMAEIDKQGQPTLI